MNSDDDDLSSSRDSYWQVQPKWVKALTIFIAIPAWLVVAVSSLTGNIGGTLKTVAMAAFAAVAVVQMVFLFRAYWRMDL